MAAANRCATQNQLQNRGFPLPVDAVPLRTPLESESSKLRCRSCRHAESYSLHHGTDGVKKCLVVERFVQESNSALGESVIAYFRIAMG